MPRLDHFCAIFRSIESDYIRPVNVLIKVVLRNSVKFMVVVFVT